MNRIRMIKGIALGIAVIFLGVSCTKDLDRAPFYGLTSVEVYKDVPGYRGALAKVYASFALTGGTGPAGKPDVAGIDEGTSDFLRLYWNLQVLTTDEAKVAWNDPGLPELNTISWTAANPMLTGLYNRLYYGISVANEFIRESSDEKLGSKGFPESDLTELRYYRAESRLLRAYSYFVALDLFGNVPFVLDTDPVGTFVPLQINRTELFEFVRSELEAVQSDLKDPRQNEYGRMDKAAAWLLLSRLYLNAEVYTGTARYEDAIANASKVIGAGYHLESDYQTLFMADNHIRAGEIIYAIPYDGAYARNYGGTTFLIHASIGGNMNVTDYGVNSGWGGIRSTKALPALFGDVDATSDSRVLFHTDGQELDINNLSIFTEGYGVSKFKNVRSDGGAVSDPDKEFTDTDFPLFRLPEAYFNYAEAVLRGGSGGSASTALEYINSLRQRAYGGNSGDISANELTLDFLLDEKCREMYWEAQRRTDLIRYGRYTGGDYVWPWKGGIRDGRSVAGYFNLFPIPATDRSANPNLEQNQGY